jgi:hypothetical protein
MKREGWMRRTRITLTETEGSQTFLINEGLNDSETTGFYHNEGELYGSNINNSG